MKFNLGDEVIAKRPLGWIEKGSKGIVRDLAHLDEGIIGVDWKGAPYNKEDWGEHPGHNLGGKLRTATGWNVHKHYLELVSTDLENK